MQQFTNTGVFAAKWGTGGTGNGQFVDFFGVAADSGGNVYVADTYNNRVQKFGTPAPSLSVTKAADATVVAGTPVHFQITITNTGNSDLTDVEVADTNGPACAGPKGKLRPGTNIVVSCSVATTVSSLGTYHNTATVDSDQTTPVDSNQTSTAVVDGTDPTVEVFSPADGSTFDQGEVVLADYSCQDETGGSGIDECAGPVADGNAIATGIVGEHDFTVTGTDNAGNATEVTNTYTVVDVNAPTVSITAPADGAVFRHNEEVPAHFTCTDETSGSGISTCVGTTTEGSPIDTSILGARQFAVTATDLAGHQTVVTHNYTIADPRPDGRVRLGSAGTYKGDNVYNTTAVGQTSKGSARPGRTVTYFVAAQNDAPFADSVRLRGTVSTSRYGVAYSSGGIDITAQVSQGTYTTAELAPGASVVIKVTVKVKAAAPIGSSLAGKLTLRSATDQTQRDTVGFMTRRS